MKKTKFLALIVVVAVMLIGASYAAWTDLTSVVGTVETGKVDVNFVNATSDDPAGSNDPGQTLDVAATAVGVTDGGNTLDVDLTATYPGYGSIVTFDVKNDSTMPVKVKSIAITNENAGKVNIALAGIAVGQEIAVGGSISGITLTNAITDLAEENALYSYSVAIEVQQWNID